MTERELVDARSIGSCSAAVLFGLALAGSFNRANAQTDPMSSRAPCRSSQLSAADDEIESDSIAGGSGHHAVTIAIQNRSQSSCTLRGVPRVTLSYPVGRPFPLKVCPNCANYLFSRQPENGIVLKPRDFAYLVLSFNINDEAGLALWQIRSSAHTSIRG
ncbi:MAG TPA: DUF4232 domain-containing protein [Bryobacteraceae bacterium]|nr:DUF4232 domain-containing protein [Bryobacteraceae bacterium]